jgi:hypothetical protein
MLCAVPPNPSFKTTRYGRRLDSNAVLKEYVEVHSTSDAKGA